MAKQLYTNNAATTLAADITSNATTLTVASGGGSFFPSPSDGNWFLATLINRTAGFELGWEIVRCTARSGDVLTVTRGQEDTTASAWLIGTPIELRWTAGSTLDANVLTTTPAGTLAASTVQGALNELDSEKLATAGGTLSGPLVVSGSWTGNNRYILSATNSDTSASSFASIQLRSGADTSVLTLTKAGTEYTVISAAAGRGWLNCGSVGLLLSASTAAGTIDFTTGGYSLRMSILSNGNVKIGGSTDTGDKLQVNGTINLTGAYGLYVNSTKVVGERRTGWVAPTGTATRTAFTTSTVTTAQLAERVKALIDDLTAHGLIASV